MRRYADYIGTVFGPEEGQKRGYCGHEGDRAGPGQAGRGDGGGQVPASWPNTLWTSAGRQPHYFDAGSARARAGPRRLLGKDLRVQSGPMSRCASRAEVTGHSVRGMYLYSAMADLAGRTGDAEAEGRLRAHLGASHLGADVCDRGHRRVRLQRGLRGGLRPAQRNRLCRDLRGHRAGPFGPPECSTWTATGGMPTFWSAPCTTASSAVSRSTARSSSTITRWRVSARITGKRGSAAPAARPTSPGCLPRWGSTSTRRATEDIAVHLVCAGPRRLECGGATRDALADDGLSVGRQRHPDGRPRTADLGSACACGCPNGARAPRLSVNGEAVSPPVRSGATPCWSASGMSRGRGGTLELPMPVERVYAQS